MTEVQLQCDCGAVAGVARDVSADSGTRIVCYCDDCQAFPAQLGKADTVLDPWGGTDIYQMPPARITISHGAQHIRCLRFGKKGTYRWYAGCCNTPIGNTVGPGWPVVGLVHSVMRHKSSRDAELGPSRGNVFTQFATAGAPDSITRSSSFSAIVRMLAMILRWKLQGLRTPSPFFSATGEPVVIPDIVSR